MFQKLINKYKAWRQEELDKEFREWIQGWGYSQGTTGRWYNPAGGGEAANTEELYKNFLKEIHAR